MRTTALIMLIGLVAATCGWILVAEAQDGGARRPLDLPTPGAGGDEEDEDAPESITFYGSEYEGDGFFWCLDKSCSMGWANEIDTLKSETTQTVNQLSARAEFSLVAFSNNNVIWSPTPRRANSGNKSGAIGWISSLQADGGTCLAAAGVATLQIANQSSKRRRQVLILGDGQPTCSGAGDESATTLSAITQANYESIPIHTLYISASTAGVSFFQQLAQQNGGTFTLVQ